MGRRRPRRSAFHHRCTAKDFRTWHGTLLAALALHEFQTFDSEAGAKENIRGAIHGDGISLRCSIFIRPSDHRTRTPHLRGERTCEPTVPLIAAEVYLRNVQGD
jgi:hypothetical protein